MSYHSLKMDLPLIFCVVAVGVASLCFLVHYVYELIQSLSADWPGFVLPETRLESEIELSPAMHAV